MPIAYCLLPVSTYQFNFVQLLICYLAQPNSNTWWDGKGVNEEIGSLMMTPKPDFQRHRNRSTICQGNWTVSRSPSNLMSIFQQSQPHRHPDGSLRYSEQLLQLPDLSSYEAEWNNINLEYYCSRVGERESHKPGGRLYAETMSTSLAVHLVKHYSSHERKSVRYLGGLSPTQLQLVIDYINDYLDQDLSLEELAAIAKLSAYHFCRSFKQSTGFSPHQYLIRQRVKRAKLFLKDEKMEIRDVAIACGFTHQSHLNRHFKRLTGVTPKIFSKS